MLKDKGAKTNFLAGVIEEIRQENNLVEEKKQDINIEKDVVDIITFCNHPGLMNLPGANLFIFLSQRVILKCFYMGTKGNENLKLNDEETNWLYTKEQNAAIEKIKAKLDGVVDGEKQNFDFFELNLACGRRSSKTLLASIISAYEAYKLIMLGDPYRYYGIPEDEEIAIINTANSQRQAGRLFAQVKARIRNAPFFKGRVQGKGDSISEIRLYTDIDLIKKESKEVNIAVNGSIVLVCGHSNPDTLRGYSSPCIIFDELQLYTEHPVISGRDFYNALKPSIALFAERGEGRLIEISTTGEPKGIFYDVHRQGMSTKPKFNEILGFWLATWDINERMSYNSKLGYAALCVVK